MHRQIYDVPSKTVLGSLSIDIKPDVIRCREYISRKFKQEFGVNLSDFLTDIRMRKAKLLLLNPHLRISDVAADVGYNDDKYFSKVFKKSDGAVTRRVSKTPGSLTFAVFQP